MQYDQVEIPNPEKDVFICYKDNDIKVLNSNNSEILTEYERIEPIRLKNIASDLMYEKSVLKYLQQGKYGLIDFEGNKIEKANYEEISSLPNKEGELLVKQNNKYGVININGDNIIDINYEQVQLDGYYTDDHKYDNAGYIVAIKTEEGYRYGYINNSGKMTIKTEYNELSRVTDINDTNNTYILCAKNGQYGILKNGKELIKNEYQSIRFDQTNKLFVVEKSKKYGIANIEGKIIVPIQYTQIDVNGIYLYAKNNKETVIYNNKGDKADIDSDIVILETSNENYKIKINNKTETKYGIIDKKGNSIIEEKYNYIEYLYDTYFIASNEQSNLGIIDDTDNVKVEIKYDAIQKIQGTQIIQATDADTKTTELYDKDFNKIYEIKNAVMQSENNYIKIYNDEEIKYFDTEGKELQNTQVYSNNKLFAKKENQKWGFADKNGNIIIECKYDAVTEFNEYGFAAIKEEEKWGVINEQGEEIIEPTYQLEDKVIPTFIGKYYKVIYGFGEFYYTN